MARVSETCYTHGLRSSHSAAIMPRATRLLHRWGTLCIVSSACLVSAACSDGSAPGSSDSSGITVVTGRGGSDTIGTRLDSVVVEVRGSSGRLLANTEIEFSSRRTDATGNRLPPLFFTRPNRGGQINAIRDTTDGAGRATVIVLMGYAGSGELIATVPGLPAQSLLSYVSRPGNPVAIVVAPRDTPVFLDGSYKILAKSIDRYEDSVSSSATFTSTSSTIQLSAEGVVRGGVVGRARVAIAMGALRDSAFASVVPRASMAVHDVGATQGDSLGFGQVDLDGGNFRWIDKVGVTGVTFYAYSQASDLGPWWISGTGRIVYSVANGTGVGRLFTSDSTRAVLPLVSASYGGTSEFDPAVSNDGAWVYYVADAGLENAVWRVRTAGGVPERLTSNADGRYFHTPALSPDDSQMAFSASAGPGQVGKLFIRQLSTRATWPLVYAESTTPRWSPNGEWILYTASQSQSGVPGALHLVHPDGTGDRVLATGAYNQGGSWSPDSRYVLADRSAGGLVLIDVATGTSLPLVFRRSWHSPMWRR